MNISVSTLYDHRKCKFHITDRTVNTFPETIHAILTHFVFKPHIYSTVYIISMSVLFCALLVRSTLITIVTISLHINGGMFAMSRKETLL